MSFEPGSVRMSHYVKHPQGAKHDADIARLEGAHKANMDLGETTEPNVQSHNPNQDNYLHKHGTEVSPTVGAESDGLAGLSMPGHRAKL